MSDDLLRTMASNSTLFVRHVENNEINRNLTLSAAGVGFVAAPTQHSRQKRWSEWHTGKVLCLLDPLDAVYNYLSQRTCNLGDTWEGKVYRVLAGAPPPTIPISYRPPSVIVCTLPRETVWRPSPLIRFAPYRLNPWPEAVNPEAGKSSASVAIRSTISSPSIC